MLTFGLEAPIALFKIQIVKNCKNFKSSFLHLFKSGLLKKVFDFKTSSPPFSVMVYSENRVKYKLAQNHAVLCKRSHRGLRHQ